ncbi:hypothetical protein, partial [Brevibacterium casei]|uniref:hypothetical protein n=1 Tax=Brevibacterium casei TaxID=33889 RepID=UPI001E548A31
TTRTPPRNPETTPGRVTTTTHLLSEMNPLVRAVVAWSSSPVQGFSRHSCGADRVDLPIDDGCEHGDIGIRQVESSGDGSLTTCSLGDVDHGLPHR